MAATYNFKKLERVALSEHSVIIKEQISSSGNKEVYKVIFSLQDKTQNMLKVIYGDDTEAQHTIDFYMNDDHDYFMEIMDYHKDGNKTFLLLKYYEKHTLHEQASKSTDTQKDHYIRSVLEIGCFLHKKNYLHADIKPDNFFLDGEQVRLGDLESMVEIEDLQKGQVKALRGAKGFKYSPNHTYTLKDEMFAYVATIYYIEMGELLLTEADVNTLDLTHNPITTINNAARENIDFIDRDGLRILLLETLDKLESNIPVDCCDLYKHYIALPALKEYAPIEIEKEERKEVPKVQLQKKPSQNRVPSDFLKKSGKNIGIVTIAVLLGWGAIILFSPDSSLSDTQAPTCHEAYLLKHNGADIIKTYSKKRDINYYTLTENHDYFHLSLKDTSSLISVVPYKNLSEFCKNGRFILNAD